MRFPGPLQVALALVLGMPAAASGATPPAPVPPPASLPAPVTPLMTSESAPFDGLLVPAETFAHLLHIKVDLEECKMRVIARDRLLAERPVLSAPLPREGWWTKNGIWVGMGLGLTLGVGVVWGAVQVLKADL